MSGAGQRVVVVGGGIIGAMCAYYLVRAGRNVTVVEQSGWGSGCSHGNCGFICPSHVLPLPAPGAVRQALISMWRPNSPFRVKPRLSPSLWKWLWNFARRCNRKDMLEAARGRHALLDSSMQLYRQLLADEAVSCEWQARGMLFVYLSEQECAAFQTTAELLRERFGVAATHYDGAALVELEPALKPGLGGGWHFPADTHLNPAVLMSEMRRVLEAHGVEIEENCSVRELVRERDRVRSLVTSSGELAGDAFVIATGALTPLLDRQLGCRIPIQPGKGYSLTMPRPARCPAIPLIFEQHRVAVTPLENGYRLGSTMEFAGYDTSLNEKRLALLTAAARHYLYEPFCETVLERWYGWRPMTYDGLPFIGPVPGLANVFLAAGHNMLGLSMGPATGKLVAELVGGQQPHIAPAPFQVERIL